MNVITILYSSPFNDTRLTDIILMNLMNKFPYYQFDIVYQLDRTEEFYVRDNFLPENKILIIYNEIYGIIEKTISNYKHDYLRTISYNEFDLIDEIIESITSGFYFNANTKLYTGYYIEVHDAIHPEIYVELNSSGDINVDILMNGIHINEIFDSYEKCLTIDYLKTLRRIDENNNYYFDTIELECYINNIYSQLFKTVIFEQKYITVLRLISDFIRDKNLLYTVLNSDATMYNLYIKINDSSKKKYINSIIAEYNRREQNKVKINALFFYEDTQIPERVYPAFYLLCK